MSAEFCRKDTFLAAGNPHMVDIRGVVGSSVGTFLTVSRRVLAKNQQNSVRPYRISTTTPLQTTVDHTNRCKSTQMSSRRTDLQMGYV
jgi:hypothetical protein